MNVLGPAGFRMGELCCRSLKAGATSGWVCAFALAWPAWEFYMHFVKTEFYLPFLCFVKNKIPVDLKV